MRGLIECSAKEPHTHQMVRLYGGNEVGVMPVYINGWICIFVFRSSLTKTQKRLFFFFFFPICVYFRCIYLIYILSTTLVDCTAGSGTKYTSLLYIFGSSFYYKCRGKKENIKIHHDYCCWMWSSTGVS